MARGGVSIPIERNPAGVPTTRQDVARQASGAGAQSARALQAFPLQPGVIVTGIACSVGPVITVIHGLGRVPKGWFTVRRYNYASGAIGEVEAGASDDKTLSLGATGAYTIDVWVF